MYLNFLVQESLCVLKIDHNNIDEIKDLTVLKELRHFSAPDNKLHSMEVHIVRGGFVCLFSCHLKLLCQCNGR